MSRRIIIFDMDGTLYDLNDVVQMSYDMQVEFLSTKRNISREEAISFLASNHVYPEMKKDSKSATELFLKLGYDKEEWSLFRNSRFQVNRICKEKAIDESVIRSFSLIGRIVLLSSNAYSIIKSVLKHIEISSSVFDDVLSSDRFPYNVPFNKKLAMQYLADKYQVSYKDMISIGDRYSTDLLPMIDLGGKGILLKQPQFLRMVLMDLKNHNLKTCDYYEFYD